MNTVDREILEGGEGGRDGGRGWRRGGEGGEGFLAGDCNDKPDIFPISLAKVLCGERSLVVRWAIDRSISYCRLRNTVTFLALSVGHGFEAHCLRVRSVW